MRVADVSYLVARAAITLLKSEPSGAVAVRGGRSMQVGVSQSVDLGQSNNPNTTPTKDYEKVRVVVYLHGVQRGCAEEGERGSTPTG